jgi:hypothetical protein
MTDCDLSLDEHDGPCSKPSHVEALAAIAARPKGADNWSALVARSEGGASTRDYLDGEPIHCGDSLELQSFERRGDDYGEYTVKLPTGSRVR